MATKVVGKLVVEFNAVTGGLEAGANRAGSALKKTERNVKSATKAVDQQTRSSRKGLQAFLEVGRGAEDFGAVFATTGFAGGIRASANNLSQFASILHPMAGALVGISVGIGSLLIPQLLKADEAVVQLGTNIDNLTNSLKGLEAAQLGTIGVDPITQREQIEKKETTLGVREEITGAFKRERANIDEFIRLEKEKDEAQKKFLKISRIRREKAGTDEEDAGVKAARERKERIDKEIIDVSGRSRSVRDAQLEALRTGTTATEEAKKSQEELNKIIHERTNAERQTNIELKERKRLQREAEEAEPPVVAPIPEPLTPKQIRERERKGISQELQSLSRRRRILGMERQLLQKELSPAQEFAKRGAVEAQTAGSAAAFSTIESAGRQLKGLSEAEKKMLENQKKDLELQKEQLAALKKQQALPVPSF